MTLKFGIQHDEVGQDLKINLCWKKNLHARNLKPESMTSDHFKKNPETFSSKQVLVGGFNPFEKYARQIGSFPQVGVKINNL